MFPNAWGAGGHVPDQCGFLKDRQVIRVYWYAICCVPDGLYLSRIDEAIGRFSRLSFFFQVTVEPDAAIEKRIL